MGSPESERNREKDEGPQHRVTIPYQFAVGKFEVTYEQWDACVSDGDCSFVKTVGQDWGGGISRKIPVVNVSWSDVQDYVKWLKKKTGKPYRLLSESEWEFAARAGTTTPYNVGKCIYLSQANFISYYKNARVDGGFNFSSSSDGACRSETAFAKNRVIKVGSYAPNKFGLYDMHGNAWEWTEDCWTDDYRHAPTDGSAVRKKHGALFPCVKHVRRGGGWQSLASDLRSARRGFLLAVLFPFDADTGFRVALTLPEKL